MNKNLKYIIPLLFIALFMSCSTDDDNEIPELNENSTEHKYLRLLISDEVTTELSLVNPSSDEVTFFDAKYPKSALYTTESGRFASIIHRDNNFIETFDSGYEFHGDHVDVKGTPKFGAMTGTSLLPTHFKSKYGELMTFNDGDGTLSIGKESDIHTPGAEFTTINTGLLKHHGAMATFNNGTYAITEKDNSIPGALPERVKIIDNTGATVHQSTIATTGIHGNASDGTYSVFGSASGVLVIESDGNQKLIPVPADFDTAWFGTILETSINGKFIGYARSKGAFLIDVITETIDPIFESSDIMQCKVSYDHNKLGVLLHSGELSIFDIATESLISKSMVISSTATDSSQKPQLIFSERFAYITAPTAGEIIKINLDNMSIKTSIKVSSTPYRLTFIGFENSIDH
ncbi:hypothetical protein [Jejuia pallidilutea]|uniref:Lipoprotein n=2 Tax=Jejuia pallidilutea TaxID=504487 RepID=A0A098LQU5_9FLAO|nr:hypothetical protein [Jejuia pallidilutea]GAL89266.1 hypothetical protein JCM19538_3346 [Jejuia pallidilutea]